MLHIIVAMLFKPYGVSSHRQSTVCSTLCSVWQIRQHQSSALLVVCEGKPPMSHGMMTSSNGDIFRVTGHLCGEFDLRLNKRFSKQPWGWWFETPLRQLWRHHNGLPQQGRASNAESFSMSWRHHVPLVCSKCLRYCTSTLLIKHLDIQSRNHEIPSVLANF